MCFSSCCRHTTTGDTEEENVYSAQDVREQGDVGRITTEEVEEDKKEDAAVEAREEVKSPSNEAREVSESRRDEESEEVESPVAHSTTGESEEEKFYSAQDVREVIREFVQQDKQQQLETFFEVISDQSGTVSRRIIEAILEDCPWLLRTPYLDTRYLLDQWFR